MVREESSERVGASSPGVNAGDSALALVDEYLALQRVIFSIAEALRQTVPTERIYLLSLGSQQGNRHVHWHVAPLPPGVPYEQQQMEALSPSRGVLNLSDEEMAMLARNIRQALEMRGTL